MTALVRLSEPWRDRTAVDRRPLQSYLEPLTIRFGYAIAFSSGGRGTAPAVDEVSHKRVLIAFADNKTIGLRLTLGSL